MLAAQFLLYISSGDGDICYVVVITNGIRRSISVFKSAFKNILLSKRASLDKNKPLAEDSKKL